MPTSQIDALVLAHFKEDWSIQSIHRQDTWLYKKSCWFICSSTPIWLQENIYHHPMTTGSTENGACSANRGRLAWRVWCHGELTSSPVDSDQLLELVLCRRWYSVTGEREWERERGGERERERERDRVCIHVHTAWYRYTYIQCTCEWQWTVLTNTNTTV